MTTDAVENIRPKIEAHDIDRWLNTLCTSLYGSSDVRFGLAFMADKPCAYAFAPCVVGHCDTERSRVNG